MNRFTNALDAAAVRPISNFSEYIELLTIPAECYIPWVELDRLYFDQCDRDTWLESVSARSLFFALLAEMSDQDLFECFGI